MATKKAGLGKGLDSLIANKVTPVVSASTDAAKKDEKIIEGILMDIKKVEPNREQPRKNFDEDALLELSESIKQFGVLQPLLVQDKKGYYEIIAGEQFRTGEHHHGQSGGKDAAGDQPLDGGVFHQHGCPG